MKFPQITILQRYSILAMIVLGGIFAFGLSSVQAEMTQNDFRFYVNTNAQTPTDPWPAGGVNLAENTGISASDGLVQGDEVRIRMSINVTNVNESGNTFKLQYKVGPTCSGGAGWVDVGGSGSGEIWRGYNNAGVNDGSTLTSTVLAVSDVYGSYEEFNNSATQPNAIDVGQDGEWDWVLENNGAAEGTTYCFRMVESDGSALYDYDDYPTIETKTFIPESQNWRWYGDEGVETPIDPLAPEGGKPTGIRVGNPIKLRVTVNETGGVASSNQKFRLEYSTASDFSSGVGFVTESGSCIATSVWCYANGVDTDDDAISTLVLTDSSVKGRHNETGTGSSTFSHSANTAVEYEFTIESAEDVEQGVLYYFRIYDENRTQSVPLASGESYPYLQPFAAILSMTISGVSQGTVIDGYTTDVATTASAVNFGTIKPDDDIIAGHRVSVTSDGYSYKVFLRSNGPFQTVTGEQISGVDGTNATPIQWDFAVNQVVRGIFGYHPDDDLLDQSSTRFSANDTWAAVDTTLQEIFFTGEPVENDVHDILYRVQSSAILDTGTYNIELYYVAVPVY